MIPAQFPQIQPTIRIDRSVPLKTHFQISNFKVFYNFSTLIILQTNCSNFHRSVMWAKMSVFKLVIFAVALCYADGKKIESMVVSKMRMSDLETSGTGYAYAQQQGYPASYITYTNHGGQKLYQPPKTAVYGVPPVALPGIPQRQFGDGLYPNLNPLIYAPQALPVAERSVPFVVKHPISHQNYKVDSTDESDLEEFRAADNNKWRPSVGHAGHDDAYVNDAGQTYDAAKYSAHGAKGEKGFEKHNEFDDGEKGAHFEDHHKGNTNFLVANKSPFWSNFITNFC